MPGMCPDREEIQITDVPCTRRKPYQGQDWKRWNARVSLKFPIPPELSRSGHVGLTWQYFGNQIIFQNLSFNHTSHSWKWAVMHHLWGYLCWLFLLGRILCCGVSAISLSLPFLSPCSLPLHCSLARARNCAPSDSLLLTIVIYSPLWD